MTNPEILIVNDRSLTKDEEIIYKKVLANERINSEEALNLYRSDNLDFISKLATFVRTKKNQRYAYYNRNFHIEPTNICVFTCSFCSFSRKLGEEGSWELSLDDIKNIAKRYKGSGATEVHIVGGVHPKRDVHYYADMITAIKEILPKIHVKAFTAVELQVMFARSKVSDEKGFTILKSAGLDSIPGGGAEIFHDDVRSKICQTKADADSWLSIHRTAHKLDIPSNCTMLYGHIEKYEHRVDHLNRLRTLQDETGGFNAFIPLKYRHENNDLSHLNEIPQSEDLKNYGVSRIFLDNIPHIKAYWPMIGRNTAQLSLAFGVDDLDGTIDDSTKIYSMAGAEDQNPTMSSEDLERMIRSAGYIPAERDSIYNTIT